jgi:hypothetical protein
VCAALLVPFGLGLPKLRDGIAEGLHDSALRLLQADRLLDVCLRDPGKVGTLASEHIRLLVPVKILQVALGDCRTFLTMCRGFNHVELEVLFVDDGTCHRSLLGLQTAGHPNRLAVAAPNS